MQQTSKKGHHPFGPLTEVCHRSEKHLLLKVSETERRLFRVTYHHQRLLIKTQQGKSPSPQKKTVKKVTGIQ